jgi:hypothetical protein
MWSAQQAKRLSSQRRFGDLREVSSCASAEEGSAQRFEHTRTRAFEELWRACTHTGRCVRRAEYGLNVHPLFDGLADVIPWIPSHTLCTHTRGVSHTLSVHSHPVHTHTHTPFRSAPRVIIFHTRPLCTHAEKKNSTHTRVCR